MSTPANWREYFARLMPTWLLRYYGERMTGMLALMLDDILTGLYSAQRAPWLLEDTSPDDALELIGEERRMEKYAGESFASYRARLYGAWQAWEKAGNESALIEQLEAFGLSNIEIKSCRSAGWDWDSSAGLTWAEGVGGADNWSRMWVVIKGHPWSGGTWADGGTWGDGGVVGLSASRPEIATLQAIVNKWRPAHVICTWIIVVLDSATWDAEQPDGTWHDWRNRSASARYIDGGNQKPVLLS